MSAGSRRLAVEDGDDRRSPSDELERPYEERPDQDRPDQELSDQGRPDGDLGAAADGVPGSTVVAAESPAPTSAAEKKPAEQVDGPPALPRLKPMPPPPVPIGTTLLETADEDPALDELESLARPDYRRASGQ